MTEMVTIPGVELFALGTWELSSGPNTFTRQDFQSAIQASQCPSVGDPIIKLGHVDPRFDGEPSMGTVKNLRLNDNGTKLLGDLQVPKWLGDSMHAAYPSRSIEASYGYRCQMGHTHPFALTGLALLGVTRPGVGNLAGLPELQQMLAASSGICAPVITGSRGESDEDAEAAFNVEYRHCFPPENRFEREARSRVAASNRRRELSEIDEELAYKLIFGDD